MSDTAYVRAKWWIPAILAAVVVALVGLFVPNEGFGYLLVIIGVVGVIVLLGLEYLGRRNASGVNR